MMKTWASESLKAAWEIIAESDWDDDNREFLTVIEDLADLREAVQLANTELTTALRQRDEALEALTLLAVTTECEVVRVSSQRDEALAACEKIRDKAKEWEGRSDAPFWNLGDIAAAALIRNRQWQADSLR